MKGVRAILKCILFFILGTVTMSFAMESVVVNTFSQEILAEKISGYVLDKLIQDVDMAELSRIEDAVRNSRSTRRITAKFIDTVIENVLHNEDLLSDENVLSNKNVLFNENVLPDENTPHSGNAGLDIEREVELLLAQNMPAGTSEEKLGKTKAYVIEHITDIQERLQANLLHTFGKDYAALLRLYSGFTGAGFRVAICVSGIACILALIRLEEERFLKTLRNISFLLAVFSAMVLSVILLAANVIDQRLAGGWLQGIHVNALIIAVLAECAVGFLLLLGERTLKKI